MKRRLLVLLFLLCMVSAHGHADDRPNFVIIFMDDMGYGDVGVFGGDPALTPELDRMAAEGAVFRDFYVPQPVCSPSRAGLLTGVNPSRMSMFHVFFPNARRGMNPAETTIARALQQAGYATAMYGKWHLGDAPKFNPVNFGFDEFFGIPYSNDMWPHGDAPAGTFPPLPLLEGQEVVDADVDPADQEVLTKRLTERAVAFIERADDEPFFIYLAHPQPHRPLYVSEAFKGKSGKGLYADVLMEIDWSVGQIRDALQRTGEAENTLVVFTSDNGPWLRFGDHGGSSGGLRQGKLTSYEGGVRVPMIAAWPGAIPPGTDTREPAVTLDFMPTMLKYAGVPLPPAGVDGRDISALLEGRPGASTPHEVIPFFYQEGELQAARAGRWKLLLPHHAIVPVPGSEGQGGRAGPQQWVVQELALFDMWNDPGETNNLASERPEVVQQILEALEPIRRDLGDTLEGYPGENRRFLGVVN